MQEHVLEHIHRSRSPQGRGTSAPHPATDSPLVIFHKHKGSSCVFAWSENPIMERWKQNWHRGQVRCSVSGGVWRLHASTSASAQ